MRRVVCLLLLSTCVFAQVKPAATPAATAKPTTVKTEIIDELNAIEKKFVSLAEAVPQEKYTWRPAEGVRSISEVYLHVAQGNFGLPKFIGVNAPARIDLHNYDKSTTDKAKIIESLKASFEFVRQAVNSKSDADMDTMTKWFGGADKSTRMVCLYIVVHQSEHLGQSIAYARSVGVTPPWSEKQPEAKKPEAKK